MNTDMNFFNNHSNLPSYDSNLTRTLLDIPGSMNDKLGSQTELLSQAFVALYR